MTIKTTVFMELSQNSLNMTEGKATAAKKIKGGPTKVRLTAKALEKQSKLYGDDHFVYTPSEVYVVVESDDVKYIKILISTMNPSVKIIRDVAEDLLLNNEDIYTFEEGKELAVQSIFEASISEGLKVPDDVSYDNLYPTELIESVTSNDSVFELAGRKRYIVNLTIDKPVNEENHDIIMGKSGKVTGFQLNSLKRTIEEVEVINDKTIIMTKSRDEDNEFFGKTEKVMGKFDYEELFMTPEDAFDFSLDKTIDLSMTGRIVLNNRTERTSGLLAFSVTTKEDKMK